LSRDASRAGCGSPDVEGAHSAIIGVFLCLLFLYVASSAYLSMADSTKQRQCWPDTSPGATTFVLSATLSSVATINSNKKVDDMTTYNEIYITETRRRIPEGGLTPFCEFMVCATVEEKGAIIGNVPLAGPFSNVESAEAVVSRMATAWIEAGN